MVKKYDSVTRKFNANIRSQFKRKLQASKRFRVLGSLLFIYLFAKKTREKIVLAKT